MMHAPAESPNGGNRAKAAPGSSAPSTNLKLFLLAAVIFALHGIWQSVPVAPSINANGGGGFGPPPHAVEKPPTPPTGAGTGTTDKATGTALKPPTLPSSSSTLRTVTDTGIDVSGSELFDTVDLAGDSRTATVMGMASGYSLGVYQSFVGSLRNTGYAGHVILGVAPDVSKKILTYLESHDVTPVILNWVNCTYTDTSKKNDIFKKTKCTDPYPDIKIRWSRFPLARDWLASCETCTGPVLITDVRDLIFQRDPFGPGSPPVKGLLVNEEHKNQTTQHWLTQWPIKDCKGVEYHETMLCSGSTVGTRPAMLKYLEIMYAEMKVWINTPKCRFDINGDDQSMHNYLFYSGQLPFAQALANRAGGIVNTVGVEGAVLLKRHEKYWKEQGVNSRQAQRKPYPGAAGQRWIGAEYNLTDDEGFFTEADGTRSRVIHQYDRFGGPYSDLWLSKQDFMKDRPPNKSTNGERAKSITNKLKAGSKPLGATGTTSNSGGDLSTSNKERRTVTDTGVDVSDPALYTGVDLHGDSSTATVMGMASGYSLKVYERFVGSLRKTGYKGNIILGVAPDVPQEVLDYFEYRGVTAQILKWVKCTYTDDTRKNDIFKKTTCSDPYPDIKIRWSRFPLARDWLLACKTCTGPVLVTDVRDMLFQRDPFGDGSPVVKGLQVFEEHKNQTTQHWLAKVPIGGCKGVDFYETMLCSGSTVGTRAAMLKYLEIMYGEMKTWIEEPTCRFDMNGDDQSIHNYLFYSGQFPFATAIPNRHGGIVNTPGVEGAILAKQHRTYWVERGEKPGDAMWKPFRGATDKNWIGLEFNMSNEDGMFTEFDGSVSRAIHQYDRLGRMYVDLWLTKASFVKDPMPSDWRSKKFSMVNTIPTSPVKIAVDTPSEKQATTTPTGSKEGRTTTDTGVDVSDPSLYTGVDLHGDSSTATVMGMASGYSIKVYERFVGSLRKTGYNGNIILGVAPDVSQEVLDYFMYRDVTPKILNWVDCTYTDDTRKNDIFKKTTCADPYPDIKIRWSRFPLARDWLQGCEACTGPVLVTDVRDMFFQRDPFGPGSPVVKGLQVFEEHKNQTTQHWLAKTPIHGCKGVDFYETMLCSGSTVGTRAAMLKYLEIMYGEMKTWIEEPKCRFDMNGDDQSIHNYLFYSGQFPFATAIPNRHGGIVNTPGVEGAILAKQHRAYWAERGVEHGDAMWKPFQGATEKNWIGLEFNLTNEDGMFTEFDGSVSRAIHQYDRFGRPFNDLWLPKQSFVKDPIPSGWKP